MPQGEIQLPYTGTGSGDTSGVNGTDIYIFCVGTPAALSTYPYDDTFANGKVFQSDSLIGTQIFVYLGANFIVPEHTGFDFDTYTGIITFTNTVSNINMYVLATSVTSTVPTDGFPLTLPITLQ